jgi:hypothetical protein
LFRNINGKDFLNYSTFGYRGESRNSTEREPKPDADYATVPQHYRNIEKTEKSPRQGI